MFICRNTIIVLTQSYFAAYSLLNETKQFIFFTFVGPSSSAGILLLKIEEGVKIYGTILHKYICREKLRRTLAMLLHDYRVIRSVCTK